MDAATAGFWGAILGGTIAGVASYIATSHVYSRQRFDDEARKFRAILLSTTTRCRPTSKRKIPPITASKFRAMLENVERASEEFAFIVQEKERVAYSEAELELALFIYDYETGKFGNPETAIKRDAIDKFFLTMVNFLPFTEKKPFIYSLKEKYCSLDYYKRRIKDKRL